MNENKPDSPKPSRSKLRKAAEPLTAEAVAAYLHANPDFFVAHDPLLVELRIPHQRGDTVSLVERQITLLRARSHEMHQTLAHLMDVARDNERLFDKTRQLILDLLDASSLEDLVGTLEDSLRNAFQVPFVSLILFSDSPLAVGRSVSSAEAHKAVGGLLGSGKGMCGTLREQERIFLFGEAQAAQIGSAAVIAINHQGLHGVLAIGSSDAQHYKHASGTLFLSYIADVLARLLPRFATPLRAVK
ncbi:MAG: DUF484 family protein [Pseudomonas sp.]